MSAPRDDRATVRLGGTGPGADAGLAPGAALGRFVIQRELGRGGMATVYEAWDPSLRRMVAVKVLVPTEEARRSNRFQAEAQVTSQLQHPNIVPVHEVGEDPSGRLWFVMKRVEGRSLRDVLDALNEGDEATAARWTRPALLRAFVQVCQAVAFAHEVGVLHRDLKPANIVVGRFGEVLVLDWGVASLQDLADSGAPPAPDPRTRSPVPSLPPRDRGGPIDRLPVAATRDGSMVGSPGYMAPEQALGERAEVGPAADVFGLGAILYELLTGVPAIVGDSMYALLYATVAGEIQDPRLRTPERAVPDDLAELVLATLAREPADRLHSAAALATAIEDHLDGARRRARADALFADALVASRQEQGLTSRLEAARRRQDALVASLPRWAPVSEKTELIATWEEVDRLEAARPLAFAEVVRLSEAALTADPQHPGASELLTDAWMRRFEEAEGRGDAAEASLAAARVRDHDRVGRYRARLDGTGAVSLVTDPPGADALAALAGEQLVLVDHIGDHRPHQGEEPAQPERHQRRGHEQQPGHVGVVAEPLQRVADHGDPDGGEERPPLADLGAEPGEQRDDDERGHRPDGARLARPLRPGLLIAAEDVVDDDVVLERADEDEPVEHQERGGPELEERGRLERHDEAATEVLDAVQQAPPGLVRLRVVVDGGLGEALPEEQGGQDAQPDDHHADDHGEPPGSLHLIGELLLLGHEPQEPGRHHVGELPDEVLGAHEPRALVVVGRELVAHRHPGRREDGVGEVEEDGADEEPHEVERVGLPPGQPPLDGVPRSNVRVSQVEAS
jgi:serine/threonine protein kinase